MKDKEKGFQQSAITTESLETPDFSPSLACYLSLRDINTTVSTCLEATFLMHARPTGSLAEGNFS